MHLGRCPGLTIIFNTLNKAVNLHPSKNRSIPQEALDTLFYFPCHDTPACVAHLHMIAWRFMITDFYRLHYDEEAPPFGEVQAYSIFTRTLERYTMLVMARAHNIRAIYQARQRRDNTPSNRLIQRSNRMIGPHVEQPGFGSKGPRIYVSCLSMPALPRLPSWRTMGEPYFV
jgi:hypothetical protein